MEEAEELLNGLSEQDQKLYFYYSFFNDVVELEKDNPNDSSLGLEVRNYINKLKGLIDESNKTINEPNKEVHNKRK